MSKMTLLLKELDCPHCADKIEKRVGELSGVKSSSLDFINKKLSNPGFVNKAPEKVVNQNKEDAAKLEDKIANIKNSIDSFLMPICLSSLFKLLCWLFMRQHIYGYSFKTFSIGIVYFLDCAIILHLRASFEV